jgi:hypothetical protein
LGPISLSGATVSCTRFWPESGGRRPSISSSVSPTSRAR